MPQPVDRSKNLEELEGVKLGQAPCAPRAQVTCQGLRQKPIGSFSAENLRIMIEQGAGLAFLVPIALEMLEREPLAEGDFYPGDLLYSMLGVPAAFWRQQPEWRDRLRAIVDSLAEVPMELEEDIEAFRAATL